MRTLVVGASSGIGRDLACTLARSGGTVVGAARRADRLAELPGVIPIACDVSSPAEVDALVEAAAARMGGIDAMVYATGLTKVTPLHTASDSEWLELYNTNLFGAARVTRAALPHLQAPDSEGRAVYLSSDAIERPFPGMVIYSTAKAALRAFARGLAHEFKELKVTEVMVGPTIGTDIADNLDPELINEWLPRWIDEGYVHTAFLQPADVTQVVVQVLSADEPPAVVSALGAEGKIDLDEVRVLHGEHFGQ